MDESEFDARLLLALRKRGLEVGEIRLGAYEEFSQLMLMVGAPPFALYTPGCTLWGVPIVLVSQ